MLFRSRSHATAGLDPREVAHGRKSRDQRAAIAKAERATTKAYTSYFISLLTLSRGTPRRPHRANPDRGPRPMAPEPEPEPAPEPEHPTRRRREPSQPEPGGFECARTTRPTTQPPTPAPGDAFDDGAAPRAPRTGIPLRPPARPTDRKDRTAPPDLVLTPRPGLVTPHYPTLAPQRAPAVPRRKIGG